MDLVLSLREAVSEGVSFATWMVGLAVLVTTFVLYLRTRREA